MLSVKNLKYFFQIDLKCIATLIELDDNRLTDADMSLKNDRGNCLSSALWAPMA